MASNRYELHHPNEELRPAVEESQVNTLRNGVTHNRV